MQRQNNFGKPRADAGRLESGRNSLHLVLLGTHKEKTCGTGTTGFTLLLLTLKSLTL